MRELVWRPYCFRSSRHAAGESTLNGASTSPWWLQRYLVFEALQPGDVIEIRFPVVETSEAYTLKWRQSEFWKESTFPGPHWEPPDSPVRYTCRFRGPALVDISPRGEGLGYPLYQRTNWSADKAPMQKVIRYIPPVIARW